MENSILGTLPPEIQLEVLERLSFQDLLVSSLLCREINILANEVITKKGSLNIKYPFPCQDMLANLTRSYRCVTFVDQNFTNEVDKLSVILRILAESKTIREVKLRMLEEIESPEMFTSFFEFLARKPEIRTVYLTSFYELMYNEIIEKIRSVLPHVRVSIVRAFENDINESFIVPSELQILEVFSEMTEIQLLTTLKTYPNLKSLRYCLKPDTNPKDVMQAMERLQLSKVPLEKLSLTDIDCLEDTTPSLNVFQSLKKLTLHFREGDIFTNHEDATVEHPDKFKFVQRLYSNNCRTLKNLRFEVSGSQQIYNLLPSKGIELVLEHMTFDMSFSNDSREEDALKFVKLFVNQQLSNLRSLYIECLEIDDEMINLLSEAEHLEKLALITCDIHFETIWPCFPNLKTLDLTDSSITYSSLQGFLGNYRIQNTLESLSLERIHPKRGRKKQLKLTSPYNFHKLKKLNLLLCNMKVDFLNMFQAPKLQQLNYDYHDFQLPLKPVLQYPELTVLCLGNYSDFDGISSILTKRNKLEIIEIGVNSCLLTTVIKHFLAYGSGIKLAKIVCTGLSEVMETVELHFKETVHNYPGFTFEFHNEREKFMKFSDLSTTIIVHTYDQTYREHSMFYENFICTLWE